MLANAEENSFIGYTYIICEVHHCKAHKRCKICAALIITSKFTYFHCILCGGFRNVADYMDRVKRNWYLSPMRAAKVQASLRIRAVSPEPSLLAHTSSESRGTFRQKAKSLAPLNGWACAVKICHDGMLEDTYSLDGAHIFWSTRWMINKGHDLYCINRYLFMLCDFCFSFCVISWLPFPDFINLRNHGPFIA